MTRAIALVLFSQALPPGVTALDPGGTYVEPLSHLSFGLEVDSWVRTEVLEYPAPPSSNHSVTYELGHLGGTVRARATCFIFSSEPPVPDELDDHFSTTLDELARIKPGFELVTRLSMKFPVAGREVDARWAMFTMREGTAGSRKLASELYLFKPGNYWVKWRITSPLTKDDDLSDEVHALVKALLPRE